MYIKWQAHVITAILAGTLDKDPEKGKRVTWQALLLHSREPQNGYRNCSETRSFAKRKCENNGLKKTFYVKINSISPPCNREFIIISLEYIT